MTSDRKSTESLGKPPVNLLAFGIGAVGVGLLLVVAAIGLIFHSRGSEDFLFAAVGIVGAGAALFVGIVTLAVWLRLHR